MNMINRIALKIAREYIQAMSPAPLTKEQFICKAQNIFGQKYDYTQVVYKNNITPVKIKCKEHNEQFEQKPKEHLYGYCKCPKCKKHSNGEIMFAQLLKQNNIQFNTDKSFCPPQNIVDEIKKQYGFNIIYAPYDFEIPSKKILVEIQGEQHWIPKSIEGLSRGRQTLQQRIRIDQGKKYYAEKILHYKIIQIPHARKTALAQIPEDLKECYVSIQDALQIILGTT